MSEVDKAVQRALALGRLEERGVAWAQRAWALLRQWAEEDGHAVTMARHGGCRYLVIEVMAQQPAFSPGQRQGLMVTARLSTDVQVPAQATPSGLVIAGGGWLAVQALALAARLLAQGDDGQPTVRDLCVTIELDDAAAPAASGLSEEALVQPLARAAAAIAEWGGWPLSTGKMRAIPIAVAQKGRLLVRLRARGEAFDPALPAAGGAVERLRRALATVESVPRPWRKTDAVKAFIAAMADGSGLGKGLAWRALLGSGPWQRAIARFPTANRLLIDALFHDTVTCVGLRADREGGAAAPIAEAVLDWRTLPGSDHQGLLRELRAAVGDDIEVEVVRDRPAVASPLHAPLLRELMALVRDRAPSAVPVPFLMPGTCDALGWRQAAVPCYGFSPVGLPDDQDALRGWSTGRLNPGEDDMRWGADVFLAAGHRFCVAG